MNKKNVNLERFSYLLEDLVNLKIEKLKEKPIDEIVKYAKELSKRELKTLTLLDMLVALKLSKLFKKEDEK